MGENPTTEPSQNSMRFKVERTSNKWSDDNTPPCPEAQKGTIQNWDRRTFTSPEEHDARLKPPWHERGTEHQIMRGPRGGATGIKRRLEDKTAWFVEVNSLEALLAFAEKYGELVLKSSDEDGETPAIEIYDAYRE